MSSTRTGRGADIVCEIIKALRYKPMNAQQVAEEAQCDYATALAWLTGLERNGLASCNRSGRSHVFTLVPWVGA